VVLVVVGGGLWPTPDGRRRYLARLEVPLVLMSYVSADPGLEAGTSRLTEIDKLDRLGPPARLRALPPARDLPSRAVRQLREFRRAYGGSTRRNKPVPSMVAPVGGGCGANPRR